MAIKETYSYGDSVKARLLNISRGNGQSYQMLVTRYLQERLLYRLSISRFYDHFFLKGGALLYAHEHFLARPTSDIDFMGYHIDNNKENVKKIFAEICSISHEQDGAIFYIDTLRIDEVTIEKKYPGVRLTLTVSLDTIRQYVSMDIGSGDVIAPNPSELDYPNLLDGSPNTDIMAYSLETAVAEKFQTMISRAETNSRMKDFYDLYTISQGGKYNAEILDEAVKVTFKNRQTNYVENHAAFSLAFTKNSSLNIRWNAFMKKLKIPTQLTFFEVMDYLQVKLKPYWENLK